MNILKKIPFLQGGYSMKKRFTRLLALLLTMIFVLQTGCAGTEPAPSPGTAADSSSAETNAEHRKFQKYLDEQFLESVVSNTITLHYTLAHPENYGITDYDITLGSLNMNHAEEDFQSLQKTLTELKGFNYMLLPEEDQLTYDILEDYLETSLQEKDFLYYTDLFSPISGLHTNLPVALAEYTFRNERDITDYLALLELVPSYLDEAVFYEKARAEKGFVMPDSSIDEVIDACESFISTTEDNILISTFNENLDAFDGLDADKKNAYKEQNASLVTSLIFPAYQKIIRCLKDIRGTGSNTQGLCYSPNGKEYYAFLIKSLVGSGHTPEELLSLIEDRINTQMMEMYQILSKSPELAEEFTDYTDDRTPDEILQILYDSISEDYPALPVETRYQIKYVPKSMEESSSPAFYMIPPIDELEENVIYINRSSTNGSGLFSTLAHEGYPGHLYQTAYASSNLSPIRKLLSFPGYQEGWGLYVEHESYIMDPLLTDKSEDLAVLYSLNSSVSIAIYAMLDLNIHYNGWSMDEAGEYMEIYFGLEDKELAEQVYNTIVSEPAYYLKYYVGYLEILLLREKAEARLEENFDLKDFHRFILDIGPCSFPVIDEYMEKWLDSRQ